MLGYKDVETLVTVLRKQQANGVDRLTLLEDLLRDVLTEYGVDELTTAVNNAIVSLPGYDDDDDEATDWPDEYTA